jgi:integrase
MHITKATVAKLELPAGQSDAIYFDDDLAGFGLRLRAGGKRSWIIQYRVGRKQRRMTIGTTAALDADKARKVAKEKLATVHLGGDPAQDKHNRQQDAEQTFGLIVDQYLAAREPNMRPRSYSELKRHLKQVWKNLHGRPIRDITRAEISLVRSKIEQESGPIAANRARSSLSSLFSWAMGEGIVDANPVIGTNKAPELSRDRVLSDQELADIWKACQADDYGRIIRLAMLTGSRRSEVAGIVETEIDLSRRMWTLPAERSKNNRAHEISLSDPALEILRGVPRREGRELLFGEGSGPFSGWSGAKEKLDERIAAARKQRRKPAPPAWVLHDIRRTVATRMADLGIAPHIVEACLNHVSGHKGGVAGIYNRAVYQKEKKQALDIWAAHVEAIVAGKAGGNIVPLARAQ